MICVFEQILAGQRELDVQNFCVKQLLHPCEINRRMQGVLGHALAVTQVQSKSDVKERRGSNLLLQISFILLISKILVHICAMAEIVSSRQFCNAHENPEIVRQPS